MHDDDRRLTAISSRTGRKVYVEISSSAQPLLREGGAGFAPAGAMDECFESLEEAIDSTCEIVFEGVARMAKRAAPSKVSSEFSFELGAEGRVWFVAKGNVKATIKVKVEWDLAKTSLPEGG